MGESMGLESGQYRGKELLWTIHPCLRICLDTVQSNRIPCVGMTLRTVTYDGISNGLNQTILFFLSMSFFLQSIGTGHSRHPCSFLSTDLAVFISTLYYNISRTVE